MVTKHTECYKNFLEIIIHLKTKINTKEHDNRQYFNTCVRNRDTNKQQQKSNKHFFERKVYRRILAPVFDNEKENWRILTNKEIYAILKTHYNRDNKVKQITLVWTCTENGRK